MTKAMGLLDELGAQVETLKARVIALEARGSPAAG